MKKLLFFYILFCGHINGKSPNAVFAENGMVVSTSRQASLVGIKILKKAAMQLMQLVQQVLL